MFSGIVEEVATIVSLQHRGGGGRLRVQSNLDHTQSTLGDSIAIEGVCLTLVSKNGGTLDFDIAAETVRRSTLGTLTSGSRVNLERALSLGSRVHGHLVTGHIDGVVQLVQKTSEGESLRLDWHYPESLRSLIAEKGSITIGGVSLTVGKVDKEKFSTYIVPHTQEVTTLFEVTPGDSRNCEVDILARYVHRALSIKEESATGKDSRITPDFLRMHGFA